MRAVSVRVNEVIGVAGYVLPGTRVDVVATASPTEQRSDMTSKVVLVQRAGAHRRHAHGAGPGEGQADAGHRRHAAGDPEQAERLALASTEGKIQLALRNPLDQGAPATPGIKPPGCWASAQGRRRVRRLRASRPRAAQARDAGRARRRRRARRWK